MFYTEVVQAVILCGSELWVMYPQIGKALVSFHHWVIWRLTRQIPHQNGDRTWTSPPLWEAMAEVGPKEIVIYVTRCQNTDA